MDDSDLEFKSLFLQEAEDLLVDAENTSMLLEDEANRQITLDKLFRLVHNFKGSAKAVGFEELSHFAHKFEDVLSQIKTGQKQFNKEISRVILKSLDVLRDFIAGLKADIFFKLDTREMIEKLIELKNRNTEVSSEETHGTEESQFSAGNPETTVVISEGETREESASENSESNSNGRNSLATNSNGTKAETSSLKKIEKKSGEEESLRVSTKKLDGLLNLIGELVVNQSMLEEHRERGSLGASVAELTLDYQSKVISEVQGLALSLRMNPVRPIFQKMKRIVRDLADTQNKEVLFESEGEDVEIDKTVFEKISDPLTHLLRNSVDHGIETAEERAKTNKTPLAKVRLQAFQREDHVLIVVSDDGKGLDPQKLIRKAIEKKLIHPSSQPTDQEAYSLIFKPGFSTKEAVTDISGRGVGMDVVKTTVDSLNGNISIVSQLGQGTTFSISIPLTLSIISGMVVTLANEKYVIPVSQLVETIRFDKYPIDTSGGKNNLLNLRGEIIPIISLRKIFKKGAAVRREGFIMHGLVASCDEKKFSFEVDEIIGQQQIVLKPLGPELAGLPGIIAGAVLSDGDPGLVLNLKEFVNTGARYVS
jgi:two-component system chemotaxis sensor kinase CheA